MQQSKDKRRLEGLSVSTGEKNRQRHPKPPSIPRSQSSKELQQTCKINPHVKAGRRILYKSYSSPNVSSSNDLKLPKPAQSCKLGDRVGLTLNGGFIGEKNSVKELPRVAEKRKTSLISKEGVLNKTVSLGKNLKELEDSTRELHGRSRTKNQELEMTQNNLASGKHHPVFFINHDDGRLISSSKLLPLLEEPERKKHDKSPWQFHDNESSISQMEEHLDYNAEPGMTYNESPWHYHNNESRYQVVDELFESDEEGLVIKTRGRAIDNGLDPIKKAMIDSWILDVTLNTSRSRKKSA